MAPGKNPYIWWKEDGDDGCAEAKNKRHFGHGCMYCTYNAHYDCDPEPNGCAYYLWNGKEKTNKYCDDCKDADGCEIKATRGRRGIRIDYCGFWRSRNE